MPTLPALDDLRCFEAAAVRLNFRAASSAVGLSPAAFSERIKRLEDRLGVRLFNRTTRRVQLTLEGERLLPQARRTLAEARACLDLGGGPSPFELTLGVGFERSSANDGSPVMRPPRIFSILSERSVSMSLAMWAESSSREPVLDATACSILSINPLDEVCEPTDA